MNKLDRYIYEDKGYFYVSTEGVHSHSYTHTFNTRELARDNVKRFLDAGLEVVLQPDYYSN